MVKLLKILWNDFKSTGAASLILEALRVILFVTLLGASTYFVAVMFGAVQFVSLTIIEWLFIFFILGSVVVVGFGVVIIALYLLALMASMFYEIFTTLPEYVRSVRNRMHE